MSGEQLVEVLAQINTPHADYAFPAGAIHSLDLTRPPTPINPRGHSTLPASGYDLIQSFRDLVEADKARTQILILVNSQLKMESNRDRRATEEEAISRKAESLLDRKILIENMRRLSRRSEPLKTKNISLSEGQKELRAYFVNLKEEPKGEACSTSDGLEIQVKLLEETLNGEVGVRESLEGNKTEEYEAQSRLAEDK
ncbi:hypothetical protein MBM_01365 [Drepanopeziza brunnea f. sp. 'multigermtubi' MB_m1]|uniref:Uncharacterized protein n=1 Tax=Marssonina brunnea f. sp. multigermtubi (strain MB_m1) TaxID=1072389 RepID=K1XJ27_MARBU|nr:uncharacterized protein MBM_01365 [Drepanopeziza brunnea f. sp. 'multigermtubi' MB_m1]EKD20683.1 hypothetical protein MBM_01365 [Drepanopeziza brunnea f. sp. 'multigermtubi' MB_m1]